MPQIGEPPYAPLLHWVGREGTCSVQLDLANFTVPGRGHLYWKAYLTSIRIAAISTVLCLLIGYPMAYVDRARPTAGATSCMLVILPFWTSFLLRVYALDRLPQQQRRASTTC